MIIRATLTSVRRTLQEAGAPVDPPTVVVLAAVVVRNPLAGRGRTEDLTELVELGAQLGEHLVQLALEAAVGISVKAADIRGYGKGAIVGLDGDREHSAAVLHPRFGAPVRAALGGGSDIIPGTKLVAGPGAHITIPIGNRDDRWVFDDMDAADFTMIDAPMSDEILVVLALSSGGRPGARTVKP
jgi:hypothetical protein